MAATDSDDAMVAVLPEARRECAGCGRGTVNVYCDQCMPTAARIDAGEPVHAGGGGVDPYRIGYPDPDYDRCDHCAEQGEASQGEWVAPAASWMDNTGGPSRDTGEGVTLCDECHDAVRGCPCGLLHADDYAAQDWSEDADAAHTRRITRGGDLTDVSESDRFYFAEEEPVRYAGPRTVAARPPRRLHREAGEGTRRPRPRPGAALPQRRADPRLAADTRRAAGSHLRPPPRPARDVGIVNPAAICVDCGGEVMFPMRRRFPRCPRCTARRARVWHRRARRWTANRWRRVCWVFARGDTCPSCQEYRWG